MTDKCIIRTSAYNAERTLVRAIESILAQTYTNWIWYLIDNGSTDSTGDIIREYAKKYPQIIFLSNKENHVIEKGNNWIDIINKQNDTDWICNLDADDEYKPEFLENMLSFAKANGLDIVASGSDFIDEASGKITGVRVLQEDLIVDTPEKFGVFFPKYHQFMRTVWGKLYSVSTLKKCDYSRSPKLLYGSDTSFCMESLRSATRVGILAKSLHKYYVSTGSVSHQMNSDRLSCDRILDDIANEFLIHKCGEISPQNQYFLNTVYFNGLKDTVTVLLNAQNSVTEIINGLHELLVNENAQRLMAWNGIQTKKTQLFGGLLARYIAEPKREDSEKYWQDNHHIILELEVALNLGMNMPDEEKLKYLIEIKERHPKIFEKIDFDLHICNIMSKYPLLIGMTAQTAVFLNNAVYAVMRYDLQTALDVIIRLSDDEIPKDCTESYLLFAQYICASTENAEIWVSFTKKWAQFLIDENRDGEAIQVVEDLFGMLPDDEEVNGMMRILRML